MYRKYFSIAKREAERSLCPDKKVGAVVVDVNGRICAVGHNKFIDPYSDCTGHCKSCGIQHAEKTAIVKSMTVGGIFAPPLSAIYCTLEPCADCQRLIEKVGIKEVYFLQKTSKRNRQCEPFKGVWQQVDWQETKQLPLTLVEIGELVKSYHDTLTWPIHSEEKKMENARNIGLALIVEAQEVLQALPWKPWKPEGYKEPDLDNLVEELADLLFFMGSMLEIFGLSWSQLEEAFLKKLEENKRRKKDGETI